jgi:hypothetical protein
LHEAQIPSRSAASIFATGTLFGEHTAHHRTPVLLTVHTMAAAK